MSARMRWWSRAGPCRSKRRTDTCTVSEMMTGCTAKRCRWASPTRRRLRSSPGYRRARRLPCPAKRRSRTTWSFALCVPNPNERPGLNRGSSVPRAFTLVAWVLATLLTLASARANDRGHGELSSDLEKLIDAGRYRQAAETLQAAVLQSPENASLEYWLGRCYYELHDYSQASSALERAVALDPNRSEYHDWLGKSFGRRAEQGSPFNAFEGLSLAHKTHREFETAVKLDATNLEAQRDLIRF